MFGLFTPFSTRSLRSIHLPHAPCRSFSFTPNHRFPRLPTRPSKEPSNVVPETLSFRQQVVKESPVESFSEKVKAPSIRNQVMFFVLGSFFVFTVAAQRTEHDTAFWTEKMTHTGNMVWKFRAPTSEEIRRARHYELGKKLQDGLKSMQQTIEEWPMMIKHTAVWSYVQVLQPILDASEGKRMCWTIGLANAAVWLVWQFPQAQRVMRRSFTHSPLSGLSYTLLTSMFSHKSFIHLAFNTMALASFGSAASLHMMRTQSHSPTGLPEATPKWHFLAFFISAGLFSGLVSHVVAARFRFPRLVNMLKSRATTAPASGTGTMFGFGAKSAKETPSILPSLGASGAIYAAVTYTALAFPETSISLLFPPTPPIPIQMGVGGFVLLDIVGALRGWRMFDHWAHLGGAAFGLWYYHYGSQVWDFFRIGNLRHVSKRNQNDDA
ncbi:hypothetical protein QCA50_013609 [Cerrena zonata]|uniref:Peptidase S54 rhomboid domain-containing protein n=1 Tax=Cerrena zonata TaxID=2478898 RepID=A0AAW0FTC3_9APHY